MVRYRIAGEDVRNYITAPWREYKKERHHRTCCGNTGITWSAITLPRGGDAGELVLALELVSTTVVRAVLLVLSVRTVSILPAKFCYYLNFLIFFFGGGGGGTTVLQL